MLKLDLRNAYNTISRDACLKGVAEVAPSILAWSDWILSTDTPVRWQGKTIQCRSGVQQGSPFASESFSLGLHPTVEEIALNYNLKSLWYFDDGVLVGKYEVVINVAEELAAIGLTLNWDKCELYSSITRSSCTIPQITDAKL